MAELRGNVVATDAEYKKLAATQARFRTSVAASNGFAIQSLRGVKTATAAYTDELLKNDITFSKAIKNRRLFNQVLNEQVELQKASAIQWSVGANGRMNADLIIPKSATPQIRSMREEIAAARAGQMSWNQVIDNGMTRMGLFSQVMDQASTNLVKMGKNIQWSGRQLSMGLTLPLVAAAAAAGATAYTIDQQLTRVAKVYDYATSSGAAFEQEQKNLRQAGLATAKTAAEQFGSMAEDTLKIQADLAATGQRGMELQQSTLAVSRAMTLGELNYQDAITGTIQLQSIYHDNAAQLNDDFNYMNNIENATSLQMQDFIQALPRGAGTMKQFGVGLKELGVLLVALKQNGISAEQGMNGLRSAALRLTKLTPQAQKAFSALTGKDLNKIIQQNGGNFIKIITDMGKAMNGLKPFEQEEIISKVFGIYQSEKIYTVMSGLINQTNQVKSAMKVMGQSAEDNAAVADRELDQWQKSASGRFKIALAELKVEMQKAGEPILGFAATALQAFTKLLQLFEKLPGGAKKALFIGAIIVAAIGPITMFLGLMMNLIGTMSRFTFAITGAIARFRGLSIEQIAEQKLAKTTVLGFVDQATAAERLSLAIRQLTQSYVGLASAERVATEASAAQAEAGGVLYAASSLKTKRTYYKTEGGFANKAQKAQFDAVMAAEAERSAANIAKSAAATESRWMGIGKGMAGLGVAAGMMGVMASDSGTMLSKISNAVLMASLLGPILSKALAGGKLAAVGSAFSAGGFRAAGVELARLLPMVLRLAGPVGLLATAALTLWQINKNIAKTREEQDKVNNSAKDWADILGFTATKQNAEWAKQNKNAGETTTKVEELRKANMGVVEAIQSAGSEQEKLNRAIQEGIKVLMSGGNATQAREAVKTALLAATGSTTQTEQLMVKVDAQIQFNNMDSVINESLDQFINQFNRISENRYKQGRSEGFIRIFSGRDDLNQAAGEAAKGLADQFWNTFAQLDQGKRRGYFDQFSQNLVSDEQKWFNTIGKGWKDNLAKLGITNMQGLMEAFRAGPDMQNVLAGMLPEDLFNRLKRFNDAEEIMAQQLVKNATGSEKAAKSVHTFAEAMKYLDMPTKSVAQAQADYNDTILEMQRSHADLSDAQKLAILNTFREAAGLEDATSIAQGFGSAIAGATGELDSNSAAMAANAITSDQWVEATKTAMSGAQSAILSYADSIFSASQQAAADAMQRRFDSQNAAIDAAAQRQDDRFDARSKALDRRWEVTNQAASNRWDAQQKALKNYYDNRIKKIKDTMDAEDAAERKRQAIFEAEKTRIQRLAEIANRNIDFNAALNSGNLDEAAKISNDAAAAQAKNAMDDAAAGSQSASDARKEAMQKRIDAIQAEEDKALESLKKRQDAEKQALKDKEDREKAALDAEKKRYDQGVEAHRKSLQQDQENQRKAVEREYDNRRRNLELELLAVRASVPRNEAEYNAQVAAIQKIYAKYGVNLKAQGNQWGKYVGDALAANVGAAAIGLTNQVNWAGMAASITNQMTEAAFGLNVNEFAKWITTGQLPKGGLQPKVRVSKNGDTAKITSGPYAGKTVPLHSGGVVGMTSGARTGVTKSASKYPSEVDTRLRIGEAVLNQNATRHLGTDFINNVNSGKYPRSIGGPDLGLGGMLMAMFAGAAKSVIQNQTVSAGTKAAALANSTGPTASAISMYGSGPAPGGALWPVHGRVTSHYGMRRHPVTGVYKLHDGADIAAPIGTPIHAFASGIVARASYANGYGNWTVINHPGGWATGYAHQRNFQVRPGQSVGRNQIIGNVGMTGYTTGPHLHFMYGRGGKWVNPNQLIPGLLNGGVTLNNGLAMLHKKETVLTAPLSQKLHDGIDKIDQNTNNRYDIRVDATGSHLTADDIGEAITKAINKRESRLGRTRRID